MLIEALVLGGQNGLFHDIRDFADPDDGPAFLAEFAEQLAFGGDNAQRNLRLVVGQRLEGRQRRLKEREDERPEQGADEGQAEHDRGR